MQELGLDARGVATVPGWEVDGVLLRSSLRKLRGICTHPQVRLSCHCIICSDIYFKVGELQKPGDKLFKPGAVKTMDNVLQVRFHNTRIFPILIGR